MLEVGSLAEAIVRRRLWMIPPDTSQRQDPDAQHRPFAAGYRSPAYV